MIRQRSAGTWQVTVYAGVDPATKRERRIIRTVRGTKTDARKLERELQVQVGQGQHRGSDLTLGELLERWFSMATPNLADKTIYNYRRLLDARILPALGHVKLTRLTPAAIDAFYEQLRTELSGKTIRNVHAILHRALGQAVKWQWVPTNPASNATPPKVIHQEIAPPDVDEVVALLAEVLADDPAFGVLLWIAAATGARRGELAGLQWGDVDLDAGAMVIQRAVAQIPGKPATLKRPKTNRARRVALGKATVELLRAYHAHMVELVGTAGVDLVDESFLFVGRDLGHLHPDTITQRWRRYADRAEVKARLQDLRHWHITQLLAAGISVRQVADRAGHAQAAMTLNVYGHALPAGDAAAAQTIDEILGR